MFLMRTTVRMRRQAISKKLGHDITNADIPPEVDAMWRGLTRKKRCG